MEKTKRTNIQINRWLTALSQSNKKTLQFSPGVYLVTIQFFRPFSKMQFIMKESLSIPLKFLISLENVKAHEKNGILFVPL